MYRVTHNGMQVKRFDTPDEVFKFINEVLDNHRNLNPTLEKNIIVNDYYQVVVYRYHTLYAEIFVIEREGIL